MGRPSTYNAETAEEICERLAGGESLKRICEDDHIPPRSVVFVWMYRNPEFADNYARARQFWAAAEFERMMEIADTPKLGIKTKTTDKGVETIEGDMIEHRKLQVDARKWALVRMWPKVFGDKLKLTGDKADPVEIVIRSATDEV